LKLAGRSMVDPNVLKGLIETIEKVEVDREQGMIKAGETLKEANRELVVSVSRAVAIVEKGKVNMAFDSALKLAIDSSDSNSGKKLEDALKQLNRP
jgi:hypothetical protein